MTNEYDNNQTMDIDKNYQCLLHSQLNSIVCGGYPIPIRELLDKRAPDPKEFRSLLEYLLFKGGVFNLHPTNIIESDICSNHIKHLSSGGEYNKRCHTCKLVCKRQAASINGVRRVSKPLALAIWEYGQPQEKWAFYDQPICDHCRKYLTANILSDEVRSKCDHIFDWLYDENIVFTPVPSEPDYDDNDKNYEYHIDDQYYSDDSNDLYKFKEFLKDIGFTGRCESTPSYSTLGHRSKCNFRNQVKQIFFRLLRILVRKESEVVWNDIFQYDFEYPDNQDYFDKAMLAMKTAIENAEHYSTKRQLLAVVAADFRSSVLREHFPRITDYQIKAARHHAYRFGRGVPVKRAHHHVERYNEQQVSHFVEFVLSPSITADLPFGIRKMKMATGEVIEVPNTCRNMISTRIIRQYQNYCVETTNGEFQPLGFTSLMGILNACPASTRKSMAGIDEYSANGSTAFDSLAKICDELSFYDVSKDEILQLQKALQQSRNYIKIDYKMHISTSSTIADHCSTYALSDPEEQAWKTTCDHHHNDQCEQCVLFDCTLARIKSFIELNKNMSDEIRIRFITAFNLQSDLVQEWKKHQLRSVHQEAARDFVLKQLNEKSVFLVVDWAMKWLEKKYRQSQTEFFGMRGLPWHLTHVVRQQPSHQSESSEKLFQNRTFCHSFDNCIQNGATVVSILQDVLIRLKQDHPEIETAFIRSDNAGCYHGAETLLAVKELYETTGVLIRRMDFSEAQAGKGPCDRKAAVIKGEIRRYVDEKHNCATSAEFVAAAKSTHHLSILSCSLPPSTDMTTKTKWEGIKKFSNIEFIPKTTSLSDIRSTTTLSLPKTISSSSTTKRAPSYLISTPPTIPSLSLISTSPPTTSSSSSSTPLPTSSSSSSTPLPTSLSSSSSTSTLPIASLYLTSTPPTSSSSSSTSIPIVRQPSIDLEVKVWRAFGIGSGKKFQWSNLDTVQKITSLIIDPNVQHLNNEWKSESTQKDVISDEGEGEDQQTAKNDDNQMDTNQSQDDPVNRHGFYLWECTDERCILQFRRRSDRDSHLDTGKHKYESDAMPLIEKAKVMYQNRLENDIIQKNVLLQNFNVIQNLVPNLPTKSLYQGWGLPTQKTNKRFNPNQKNYMIDAYNHGEQTGFKMNSSTLALEMPYVKENGQFRFKPEEWLTAKQIKSFFSTLTQKRRRNSKSKNAKHISSQKKAASPQIINNSQLVGPHPQLDKVILENDGEDTFSMDTSTQMSNDTVNLNFETDTDAEEENEEDFDGKMIMMDMEDILDSAKEILIPQIDQ